MVFVCGVAHFRKSSLLYPTVALQLVLKEAFTVRRTLQWPPSKVFFLQIIRHPGCESRLLAKAHGYQLNTAAWVAELTKFTSIFQM